jgi:hypothetical protein
VEWELHRHCRQAREQQHGHKADGGEVTCRRGMGTSSSLIWSGVPDTQDTFSWGLQQELGGGWRDITGKPRMTEVTDAGGPTRLSKVVAMSVVQGVGLVCAGWDGVAGERAGLILHMKQAVTANIANQR